MIVTADIAGYGLARDASSPRRRSGFPLHRFPKDYFRFGEDAYREIIFDGRELLDLREVPDPVGSPCLCGMGVLKKHHQPEG